MTVYQSLLLLFAVFTQAACQEFDRHELVQSYWQLEDIQTEPEIIRPGGGMDQLMTCEKDDSWKFAANGILRTYRGDDHCRAEENFTDIIGGWTLNQKGTRLMIRESGGLYTEYEVLNFQQTN